MSRIVRTTMTMTIEAVRSKVLFLGHQFFVGVPRILRLIDHLSAAALHEIMTQGFLIPKKMSNYYQPVLMTLADRSMDQIPDAADGQTEGATLSDGHGTLVIGM